MLPKDKFLITEFYGIRESFLCPDVKEIDRSRLEEIAEAGFNLITLEGSPDINKKALLICDELGLLATVIDSRMHSVLSLFDGWENTLSEIVNDYKDFPALFNYHIVDEPSNKDFRALRKICDKLYEFDPKHEAYINLFPNYATPKQLGAPTYEAHVESFIKEVNPTILSYDHYHFCKGKKIETHEFSNEREKLIYENAYTDKNRAGFFDNIEQIRKSALENSLPFMVIVLLVEHGPYRYLSEGELRWEVFQSLAYGANAISYFTYWTPLGEADDVWHWKEGIISADGKKNQHYFDVKKINPELQNLGTALLSHKSEAVFHIGECKENVRFFNGYGGIDKIDANTASVGFFEDNLMLIANKDYKESDKVVLHSKFKLLKLDKINNIWLPLKEKKINIAPGDGELIKIIK